MIEQNLNKFLWAFKAFWILVGLLLLLGKWKQIKIMSSFRMVKEGFFSPKSEYTYPGEHYSLNYVGINWRDSKECCLKIGVSFQNNIKTPGFLESFNFWILVIGSHILLLEIRSYSLRVWACVCTSSILLIVEWVLSFYLKWVNFLMMCASIFGEYTSW